MRLQTENAIPQVKPAKLPLRQRMLAKAKDWVLRYVISQSFLLPNYAASQPIAFTDAPSFKLGYVIENEQLQEHLATLRNPLATEQQKLAALSGISTIFLQQGGTLTHDDISQTISTLNGYVLGNHSLSTQVLTAGCGTTTDIFNSPANLITSDADSTLISLASLVTGGQGSTILRTAALQSMNQPFARAEFANTQEQFGTVLGMLQELLPDGNSPMSVRAASLEILTSVFSQSQEANVSAAQLKACMQEIGAFVSSNPQNEDACAHGAFAISQIFARDLQQLIDNECVGIGLETARIAMNSGYESAMTYSIGFTGALFRTQYNAVITSQDMANGMNMLTSALSSSSFNVRQGALFYLKTILQNFIDFRADVSLTALQSNLTAVSNYLVSEPDAYLKEQAIAALQAGMNHKTAQFTPQFISGMLATLKQTADNVSLPPGTRTAAGGALLNGCFVKPEFFDASPYSTLFNLTSATARQMLLNSPDWTEWGVNILGHIAPLESQISDYRRMYSLAKANPNAPVIAAIFGTTGITYYNEFSQPLLQHLYYNRNTLTGKAPLFWVMTTHRGGADMGSFITQDYLDRFDMRPIQPGSDTTMHAMLVNTASRLGIAPKDVNPNGAKFRLFTVSGHADANVIYLQPFITREDAALLKDMGRYFAEGSRGFIYGCESMGIANPPYALPFGEMVAVNMGIRMFGAQQPMGGVDSTAFAFENGQWAISDLYLDVPRTSADYGIVPPLPMSGWTAVRVNGNTVQLNWSVQSNGNTEGFDVMMSTDGKVFERIGIVPKGSSNSHSFTDENAQGNRTYRITQRDGTPVHGDGSLHYSFSSPETRTVGGVIGIGNEQGQPRKFELLQNYPNPFNSSTIISYSIPKDEKVLLTFYNILGQEIATPVNGMQQAGQHTITFDASNLASGVYFYSIKAGEETAVKRMVLAK